MRRFDLFTKSNDAVQTTTGGIITLCTLGAIALLTLVAVYGPGGPEEETEAKQHALASLEKGAGALPIHIEIDVAYPCHLLHLKIRDGGTNEDTAFERKIRRTELTTAFTVVRGADEILDTDPRSNFSQCPGCLGSTYVQCCRTCFDIAGSFQAQGKLVPNLRNVEQCMVDKAAIRAGKACRVKADLSTSLRSGSLLVKAGGEIMHRTHFKNDLSMFGDNANLTHTIRSLRFGTADLPGVQNPLDGAFWKQPQEGFYQLAYRVRLVPTKVGNAFGHQYSAYFTPRHITKMVSKRHPGILFEFDTYPVGVEVVSAGGGVSLRKVVFSVIAVIGGAFTIGGLLDSFVFSLM